jgi:signal transduction histidine kinase
MRKGEEGSVDRDLYVFCADANQGILTVHPFLLGRQIRNIIDRNGKTLGADIMREAKVGMVGTISYFWARPGGDTTPVEKISFFTKVADQVCGVGYYK